MFSLWQCQSFCLGVAVSIGCVSWLSHHYDGLGHIPRMAEFPGIFLSNGLDYVPVSIERSSFWPGSLLERLEGLLDNYQCPSDHEYRVEIVNHAPVILRLRRFLAPGERDHLLKLAGDSPSYISKWTADDPTRMYLEPDEDRVVGCLETRISDLSGYPIYNQEAIQIVYNNGTKGEDPEKNLWPEWLPSDTKATKRIARMVMPLEIESSPTWEIDFTFLKKTISLEKDDALFWWSLLPDGSFDKRIMHKIKSREEVISANVFIDQGFWRPSWWEQS